MRFHTLTRNNDFRRAYQRGKSFVGYGLVLYVIKNREKRLRIGITCSKKIGNAVRRNRARRVIRAAAAEVLPGVQGGVDLVFVARSATAAQKSGQVAAVMRKLLCKAGLLAAKPAPEKAELSAQPAPEKPNSCAQPAAGDTPAPEKPENAPNAADPAVSRPS